MNKEEIIEFAAKTAHDVNNLYRAALGEEIKPAWADCSEELRASVRSGVEGIIGGNTPEKSHEGWMKFKEEHGWTYGPTEDAEAKTHPCMVPYGHLPEPQRLKDTVFHSVVRGMLMCRGLLEEVPVLSWSTPFEYAAIGTAGDVRIVVTRDGGYRFVAHKDGLLLLDILAGELPCMRYAITIAEKRLTECGVKFRSTL